MTAAAPGFLTWLEDDAPLPPTRLALGPDSDAPGLVAAGGRLDVARLEEAYRRGIFPWYGPGQPVLWWSPDPRMVLPVTEFRIAPSLRKTIRRFLRTPGSELRFDSACRAVIEACATTPRPGQEGTWIVPTVADAYARWHERGAVHSVETWVDGQLVGGLYFVAIGRMVFGESMFARHADASKIALAALVAACRARGVAVVDCQQNTAHLARFGAREIPRDDFERHLTRATREALPRPWSYDSSAWATLGLALDPDHAA
ncbi:MAG: leucyl/phenylalanyl-tRNA--protein transferase [Pseudomonadota bacterium]|jgi:leucyl/phenylalanyl-tRNA--protein transferase|nr:leucyl/phenylalanyl-tRNA--protein transferase [Rubrivivax sp.]MCA3257757.1 leucyl/phenylalanyl-tRNA--protein transferase [Rubrivivax sp.]MCE2912831.1 leucyl/phenylalanyl-tRNA--protein transferase [Rubrivivax sp.]MCZ8030619.1 leucyl/phenylalanyl-tRNA--protein transferase [Rubrivivax sp.]